MDEEYIGNSTHRYFKRVRRTKVIRVDKPHFYEVGAAILDHIPRCEEITKKGYFWKVKAASFLALKTSFDSKFWVSEGMDIDFDWRRQSPMTDYSVVLTIFIKPKGEATMKLYSKEDSRKKFVWILLHNSVVETVKLYYKGKIPKPPEVEFVTKTRTNSEFVGIIFLKGDSEKYKNLEFPSRRRKVFYVITDAIFGLFVKLWKKIFKKN